jgi:hypothetical protein
MIGIQHIASVITMITIRLARVGFVEVVGVLHILLWDAVYAWNILKYETAITTIARELTTTKITKEYIHPFEKGYWIYRGKQTPLLP